MPETPAAYTARMLALAAGADPLETLAATPSRLGQLLAGRTAADLRQPPAPERWSAAQLVTHLADAEIVFAYRMRQILAAPGTAIQAYDQNAWLSAQHAEASDAHESLALFTALRGANVRLLRRLTGDQRQRYGVHAERGNESIAHLMAMYAGHDRNHLAQIETAVGAPAAGGN